MISFRRFFKLFKRKPTSSTEYSLKEVEEQFEKKQFGNLILTDAVRPGLNATTMPEFGYREDIYYDKPTLKEMPCLVISVSEGIVFDLFMDLINLLGQQVDVILESEHPDEQKQDLCQVFVREEMETVVLQSCLSGFEDLLLNDGLISIFILGQNGEEIVLDDHKLLFVYTKNLVLKTIEILTHYGVPCIKDLNTIPDMGEHIHQSDPNRKVELEELVAELGADNLEDSFV